MRTFIAINLPEELKTKITEIQLPECEKKNVEKENLHLTLKFLGEVSEEQIKVIKERLRRIKFKKFTAKINQAGVFDENFLKIIWLRIENCGELRKKLMMFFLDYSKKKKDSWGT